MLRTNGAEMTTDPSRRKQLTADYKRATTAAGVYCIRNTATDRVLLGISSNLPAMANRVAFAHSTGSPGALDGRLRPDIDQYGIEAFTFEVLEELESPAGATPAEIRRDLEALEALWRERLSEAPLY